MLLVKTLPVKNSFIRAITPTKLRRLFFITTLYTHLADRCHTKYNYAQLHEKVDGLTPNVGSFDLPALFTNKIWGDTALGDIDRNAVVHNQLTLDTILAATPFWLQYDNITDQTNDIMLVFKLIQSMLRLTTVQAMG